uniref:(California timema) hypothetical protein n=1 Tax=Timema californicum TaxID=61474 RepID=A0A7R9P7S0_TIMCA|nr:unnamed protein product [Timema californicum]
MLGVYVLQCTCWKNSISGVTRQRWRLAILNPSAAHVASSNVTVRRAQYSTGGKNYTWYKLVDYAVGDRGENLKVDHLIYPYFDITWQWASSTWPSTLVLCRDSREECLPANPPPPPRSLPYRKLQAKTFQSTADEDRGSVPAFAWRGSGNLSTSDRYSNLDLPVIDSLVYCDSSGKPHHNVTSGSSCMRVIHPLCETGFQGARIVDQKFVNAKNQLCNCVLEFGPIHVSPARLYVQLKQADVPATPCQLTRPDRTEVPYRDAFDGDQLFSVVPVASKSPVPLSLPLLRPSRRIQVQIDVQVVVTMVDMSVSNLLVADNVKPNPQQQQRAVFLCPKQYTYVLAFPRKGINLPLPPNMWALKLNFQRSELAETSRRRTECSESNITPPCSIALPPTKGKARQTFPKVPRLLCQRGLTLVGGQSHSQIQMLLSLDIILLMKDKMLKTKRIFNWKKHKMLRIPRRFKWKNKCFN